MDRLAYRLIRRRFSAKGLGIGDVSSANVRKTFIEYFERDHNHLLIPSSPVMPKSDGTIAFVNCGMAQFKNVMFGKEKPASTRVVNSQKCIRIKGKHNDLDCVGIDGTHHTFFEMLGNWSFGDYYKKEACLMSWKLLTEVYGIPKERLYVTYFNGDEGLNLPPDLETKEIWAEIGIPENRILPFGMKDNFWEAGTYGPCGPCTEIHYDHIPGRGDVSSLVNTGDPTVTELWNLVFTEFSRMKDGVLHKLGKRIVDTGMGYERLVAVLQGQMSNYETDLFRPLFDVIQRKSNAREYTATYGDDKLDIAYRMLADHARMLTVAISDGMTPNVHTRIRTIFRKVFSLQKYAFDVETGLVKELSNHVAEMLSPVYPEIGRNLKKVHWLIDEEEKLYREREAISMQKWRALIKKEPRLKTLQTDMVDELLRAYEVVQKSVLAEGKKEISAEVAWNLLDTHGIRDDVIEELAKVLGLSINKEENAKLRDGMSTQTRVEVDEKYMDEMTETDKPDLGAIAVTKTDDKYHYYVDKLTGDYEVPRIDVRLLSVLVDGKPVDRVDKEMLKDGKEIGLVFDRSPFFTKTKESGSDKGFVTLSDSTTIIIHKAVEVGDRVIHYGVFEYMPESYDFTANNTGVLNVTITRRKAIMRSNTAALVFKALLQHRMKIFSEVTTFAVHDKFMLTFTGYPVNFETRDFMEMERDMAEALKILEPIDWKLCTVPEIRQMNDLMITPGDTFVEPLTPIARVHTPWMTARFRCNGPVTNYLGEVNDFVITNFESAGYRLRKITCMTGERAAEAKFTNAKFAEEWNGIRDFHIVAAKSEEEIEAEISRVQRFLKKVSASTAMSYFIKKCIMEEAETKIVRLKKYARREVAALRKKRRKEN